MALQLLVLEQTSTYKVGRHPVLTFLGYLVRSGDNHEI
jgi:hypothetical protein